MIDSEASLPDNSALSITFSYTDYRPTNRDLSFPVANPDLQALNAFASDALALTCLEVIRQPFSSLRPNADTALQSMNARRGEIMFDYIPGGTILYSAGDKVRDLFKRR